MTIYCKTKVGGARSDPHSVPHFTNWSMRGRSVYIIGREVEGETAATDTIGIVSWVKDFMRPI